MFLSSISIHEIIPKHASSRLMPNKPAAVRQKFHMEYTTKKKSKRNKPGQGSNFVTILYDKNKIVSANF